MGIGNNGGFIRLPQLSNKHVGFHLWVKGLSHANVSASMLKRAIEIFWIIFVPKVLIFSKIIKAHLDNFWSEFFEQSAKPRAAIQIFNVAIGWASIRVICFCSTQTLQRLKVLKCIFMWKQGLYERFRFAKMLSATLCFATVRDPIKNRLIGSHSREPKSKLYGIQKIVAGKLL